MKKPSMFSKNYDKEVKRRKRIIILMIIVPIIGLSIFLTTNFNGLLSKSKDNKETKEVVKGQTNTENPKDLQATVALKAKAKAALKAEADLKANAKGGTLLATMPDGKKISVEYNVVAGEKNIKGVISNKDILYDISPSKKAIVMQSKSTQDLLYFDVNKISKDITKKVHTSSKNENFSKQDKLKVSPNYIWSINPKFIDEDNIAYVSELPWMNEKSEQYIWKINLKSNVHMQAKPASGTNITFKSITPKGLEANIDGNSVYVNSLGEVTSSGEVTK
ncbi:MAG TPA: hypothetical protein VIM70_20915 [Clostridium sp.]|uniref:hypothetical protein n=1 Tax=Clostridium sp. TaxID=1506 RepID=UPI002F94B59C